MNALAARALLMLVAFGSISDAAAMDSILDQVPRLQKVANLANTGALGCGGGETTIVTSRGQVTAEVGLDPIHVFGDKVAATDLLALLQSRVDFNRTREVGPMSGDVVLLCSLGAQLLGASKDPAAIPVLTALLDDKEISTSAAAAMALLRLGDLDEELRPTIRKIALPKYAVLRIENSGKELPEWFNSRK